MKTSVGWRVARRRSGRWIVPVAALTRYDEALFFDDSSSDAVDSDSDFGRSLGLMARWSDVFFGCVPFSVSFYF